MSILAKYREVRDKIAYRLSENERWVHFIARDKILEEQSSVAVDGDSITVRNPDDLFLSDNFIRTWKAMDEASKKGVFR